MGLGQEPPIPLFSLSSLSSRLLFLLLLFSLLSTASALDFSGWSVLPSNRSSDLSWTRNIHFQLESALLQLPANLSIAPLTQSLVHKDQSQLSTFHATGQLRRVDAANSLSLQAEDIAIISCDPSAYPGNLDASETVANVLTSQQKPSAVLLYTTEANHCNYSTHESSAATFANVFTLLTPDAARALQAVIDSSAGTGTGSTSIVADMSYPMNVPLDSGGDDGGGGGGNGNSPNTAMIILYSITGIITALFLAIIIMGAVRAHRHPERYGPRYTTGRPRQSRARGIARAMLETIPIVKFGDDYDPKADPVKGDVEMATDTDDPAEPREREQEHEMTAAGTGHEGRDGDTPTRSATSTTHPQPASDEHQPQPQPQQQQQPQAPTAEQPTTEYPNFSCPICTDDFVKGQDLRVLPCNHKFHPECIDPWLVNVSGTCPLCRIDLNPARPEGEANPDETEAGAAPESPREGTPDPTTGHRHRRLSSYLHGPLNARRMRDASVEERLAALRSVREEATNPTAEGEAADVDEGRRRSRLTQRLRDRFRIRTQPHREASPG
ncbi:hypothetical protein BDV59DRAFT_186720 [Aspergillus ambiguus]|uniref:RING-H2 finger protein n=1 Tax=Aspergillus ambiguus TaxID=176160 RepID=UPI003CCD3EEA